MKKMGFLFFVIFLMTFSNVAFSAIEIPATAKVCTVFINFYHRNGTYSCDGSPELHLSTLDLARSGGRSEVISGVVSKFLSANYTLHATTTAGESTYYTLIFIKNPEPPTANLIDAN
jgi:hypothetical protein